MTTIKQAMTQSDERARDVSRLTGIVPAMKWLRLGEPERRLTAAESQALTQIVRRLVRRRKSLVSFHKMFGV